MPSFQIESEYRRSKRGTKYGNGRLGGYPGLTFTAHQIAEYFPKSKVYVEPFAGLGRTAKYSNSKKIILNDKSDYAVKVLRNKFFNAYIFQKDFMEIIKEFDSIDTFFFIDPPWRQALYDGNNAFLDRKPIDYYTELLAVLPSLKGDWFLCSDHSEKEIKGMLSKSNYPNLIITSRRTILGKPAKVRIISNKPFTRHNQNTLTSYNY